MSGVPAHPDECHGMDLQQVEQACPEVCVKCGGFIRLAPSARAPRLCPSFLDAVDDVLRVGGQRHGARLPQGGQCGDDGCQLHAVIGCCPLASGHLLFGCSVDQNCAPSSGARVSAARAVGVNVYLFHGLFPPVCGFCGWGGGGYDGFSRRMFLPRHKFLAPIPPAPFPRGEGGEF